MMSGGCVGFSLLGSWAAYQNGGMVRVRSIFSSGGVYEYTSYEHWGLLAGLLLGMAVGIYLWRYVAVGFNWLTQEEASEIL